jgi:hypothetical protein
MNINRQSIKNINTFVKETIQTFRIQIVKWIFKNLEKDAGMDIGLTFRTLIVLEHRELYSDLVKRKKAKRIPSEDEILHSWFKYMIQAKALTSFSWGDESIIAAFKQMTKINVVIIRDKIVERKEPFRNPKLEVKTHEIQKGNYCDDGIWLYRVNDNHYKIIFPFNVTPTIKSKDLNMYTDINRIHLYSYDSYNDIETKEDKLVEQMQQVRAIAPAQRMINEEGWESKINNFENMIVDTSKKWTDIEPEIDKLIKTEGGRNINMHFNNKKSKKPKKTKKRVLLNKKTKKRVLLNKNKTKVNKIVLTKKLIKSI